MENTSKKLTNPSFLKETLPLGVLLLLTFILPVLFIPSPDLPIEIYKKVVLSLGVLFVFIWWLAWRLIDGRFVFPKSFILNAGAIVLLLVLLSALFSPVIRSSFVGKGYEIDTFFSWAIFFVLFFLISIFSQAKNRISYFYTAISASFVLVFIFQVLNVFWEIPFLGQNIIGRWNDFGIFSGLIVLSSVSLLELSSAKNKKKILLGTMLLLGIISLILVNFSVLWWMLAVFSLAVFLYGFFTTSRLMGKRTGLSLLKNFKRLSLGLFVVSVVFAMWASDGSAIDNQISKIAPSPIEVRPSWQGTISAVEAGLEENVLFGAGPNRFTNAWLANKPASVNQSLFWNVEFGVGVGHVPGFLVTHGVLGLLAWVLFIGLIAHTGFRVVFKVPDDHPLYAGLATAFWSTLFLWGVMIFYIPNTTLVFLAFLSSGIFVSFLVRARVLQNYVVTTSKEPVVGFVSVLVVIILLVASLVGGYLSIQKTRALAYFQEGKNIFTQSGNIDLAEKKIVKATKLDEQDVYYRQLADIYTAKLQIRFSRPGVNTSTIESETLDIFNQILGAVNRAKELDPTNYLNWIAGANMYEILLSLGNNDFYDLAKSDYDKALEYNPKNPIIFYRQAQLELLTGNIDATRENLNKALEKKFNYTPALFLLSQIDVREGNIVSAIKNSEQAVISSPNNIGALFQLGFLYYSNGNYDQAVRVLERAVSINPNYANAKYFLGLAYWKIGQRDEAVTQFEELSLTNPENQNVINILSNLRAGRSALSGIGQLPEKRNTLPIEE